VAQEEEALPLAPSQTPLLVALSLEGGAKRRPFFALGAGVLRPAAKHTINTQGDRA
jgi:hypothetical protein